MIWLSLKSVVQGPCRWTKAIGQTRPGVTPTSYASGVNVPSFVRTRFVESVCFYRAVIFSAATANTITSFLTVWHHTFDSNMKNEVLKINIDRRLRMSSIQIGEEAIEKFYSKYWSSLKGGGGVCKIKDYSGFTCSPQVFYYQWIWPEISYVLLVPPEIHRFSFSSVLVVRESMEFCRAFY